MEIGQRGQVPGANRTDAGARARQRILGGGEPYPAEVSLDCRLHDACATASRLRRPIAVAGRVADCHPAPGGYAVILWDSSGPGHNYQLRVAVRADVLGASGVEAWQQTVQQGDHAMVVVDLPMPGAEAMCVRQWHVLGRPLRTPRPSQRAGRNDGLRHRRRHEHFLADRAARDVLVGRAQAIRAIRSVLEGQGYLEVDTPLLLAPDRASEHRAFRTLADSVNTPLYLRASPLHLKLLLASGFDRVCEVLRCFRDEPMDARHSIEYSLIEAYQAYGSYETMRVLAQQLIRTAAHAVNRSGIVANTDSYEADLDGEWPVVTIHQAVSNVLGADVVHDTPAADLHAAAADVGLHTPDSWHADRMILEIYEKLVEPNTIGPVFFTDFPASLSPMARVHRFKPGVAEKWDLVIFGREIATAYTELVDAAEQRRRLEHLWEFDDTDEAVATDREFLELLELGMPPCGGLTIGVERLLMTLTGTTDIREVIPFPLVTPAPNR